MLVSPWQDRHPRSTAGAALPGADEVADVVVVGGGLTGLATALELADAGQDVVVLEAAYVGAGTTGRSTAKVSLLQGTHLSKIAHRHPTSTLQAYVAANRAGQQWVADFCAAHEVAVQHRPAYTYATTSQGESAVRAELDAARSAELPVAWTDELELPYRTRGGIRLDDQLQVDPVELLHAMARVAADRGVRIVADTRVTKVRGRDPVLLTTDSGATVRARRIVVATNTPVLDRGAFFARLSPGRSYGMAFRTPHQAVAGMYLSADSPSRSLRDGVPEPGHDGSVLLVGGNGHTTGRGGSTADRVEDLRRWTREHFTDAEETHAWSAQDYLTHHALPYAGPVLPGVESVLVAGGYSKWGMTNAVAAALALRGHLTGDRPGWADALRTWAPSELRGALDSARANAEVGFEMGRGWLRPAVHPTADADGGDPPPEGRGVVRGSRRGPVAVATSEGTVRRVSGVCTHLGGVVSFNDAERSWDCPLHGSRFGLDGEVLDGPATCGLRPR